MERQEKAKQPAKAAQGADKPKAKPVSKATSDTKLTDVSVSRTAARAAKPGVRKAARPISTEQRRQLIAEAAYFRALSRGFEGDPVADWLDAEREVDKSLGKAAG